MRKLASLAVYGTASLIGIIAFAYPFFVATPAAVDSALRLQQASLISGVLLSLCLIALLFDLQTTVLNSKTVAMLGLLVALASVLRFIETAFPLPGGFSPIFAPIILVGAMFGWRLGFLMGVLTILTSALIIGGVGPWLPYQMFGAGWIGAGAALFGERLTPSWRLRGLLGYGFVVGFLYGFVINLYSWPFLVGDPNLSWQSGIGFAAGLQRYLIYYATTSLVWDAIRAVGNVLLLALLGLPAMRVLGRFARRLSFEVG